MSAGLRNIKRQQRFRAEDISRATCMRGPFELSKPSDANRALSTLACASMSISSTEIDALRRTATAAVERRDYAASVAAIEAYRVAVVAALVERGAA